MVVKWYEGLDRNEPVAIRSDIEAALRPATEDEIRRDFESGWVDPDFRRNPDGEYLDDYTKNAWYFSFSGYRAAERAIKERVAIRAAAGGSNEARKAPEEKA